MTKFTITKVDELSGNTILQGLIFGVPGIGKSTLALSAPNPLCIDFDRGMHRVQNEFRTDSLQVTNFSELLELIKSDVLDNYETVVIDTIGEMVAKIGIHLSKINPKTRQGDGTISTKGWGLIKDHFIMVCDLLKDKQKNLIFVAHEKVKDREGVAYREIAISGSSGDELLKRLDFVGYMEMINNKRTISFAPSEKYYAKNSIQLESYIEIPDLKASSNTFLAEKIFKLNKEKLLKEEEQRRLSQSFRELIDSNIASIETLEDLNNLYEERDKKQGAFKSDKEYLKDKIMQKAKEMKAEFDKKTNKFVIKEEK